jgi:hypothetical protein
VGTGQGPKDIAPPLALARNHLTTTRSDTMAERPGHLTHVPIHHPAGVSNATEKKDAFMLRALLWEVENTPV